MGGEYVDEMHEIGGASLAIQSGRSYIRTNVSSRFYIYANPRMGLPNGLVLPSNVEKIEITLQFNMKRNKVDLYFNGELIGTAFEDIPDRIIPAVGLYGNDCTVSIAD